MELTKTDVAPSKYRGFDITFRDTFDRFLGEDVRQIFATNGKFHLSALCSPDKSDIDIWKLFKPGFDREIDRFNDKEVA